MLNERTKIKIKIMKLWKDKDFKVYISDIETLKSLVTLGFYNSDDEEWKIFEISEFKNDLYSFIKFYNKSNIDYVCGFNFCNFDAIVIQYIIENYENWYNFSGIEICKIIYEFSQKVIDDKNYNLRPAFYENQFHIPVIDVFLILGLDNQARMSSLKSVAFQIDGTVEEMPYHHSIENITPEQIEETISYMKNDIRETYKVLKLVLGETEIKSYSKNNQLELRIDIREEFGLNCLNLSEIKIGEELLKIKYAEALKKSIKELPKKGTFRKKIELKRCFPKYINFKTKQLQDLYKKVSNSVIKQDEGLKNEFKFYNTTYTQALGGAHSINFNEIWESDEDYQIESWDVSSYYPAIIVNNGIYPYHLGKELLSVYKELYLKRIELKPLSKNDKKIKGIVDAYKLILNVVFGKMGSMESWLFDKEALLSVTLTGQFTLFMLIEMLELEGIRVISANSDGIEIYFHKSKKEIKDKILEQWKSITNFELEGASYKKIVYSSVNDYIVVDDSNKVKRKGDYEINDLVYKNKSNNIIPLALEAYFVNGIKPEEFVNNHKNIYDFCARAKATKNFHYEGINKENGEKTVYNKLIRYYTAKKGEKLLKIKNEDCDTNAAKVSEVTAGKWLSKVVNFMNPDEIEYHLSNIDKEFYLEKINSIIISAEKGKKIKKVATNPNQISMF